MKLCKAPEDFIRGLIDSDGCRVVANDRGVRSVRYHFTNRSEDILGLFTATLDRLAIPWTRNSRYMIAVFRKTATARIDEFVGPKSGPPAAAGFVTGEIPARAGQAVPS